MEDDLREAGPEAAPPAREQAGVRGGAGTAEAGENLEQHVVGKGADPVLVAVGDVGPRAGGALDEAPTAAFKAQLALAAEVARINRHHLSGDSRRAARRENQAAPGRRLRPTGSGWGWGIAGGERAAGRGRVWGVKVMDCGLLT